MYEASELYRQRKSHRKDTVVVIHAEIKTKGEVVNGNVQIRADVGPSDDL